MFLFDSHTERVLNPCFVVQFRDHAIECDSWTVSGEIFRKYSCCRHERESICEPNEDGEEVKEFQGPLEAHGAVR